MYKKNVLLLMLILATLLSRAQISMTLQVPPVGALVKTQLWNLLLVNSGGRSLPVRIRLALLDEKTNQVVMTASTLPFILDKGARQIQAKDLGPIEYAYNGPAALTNHDPNGMLPAGSYQACYTVANGEGVTMIENCILVAVDPLSPPLLNTPANEGSIYTASPQFTWLPPTPISIFSDLSYDLVLVEVLSGQGKADAIEQNIPVYTGGFIRSPYMNYPSSYRALDTAKTYAWRIVAMNSGQPIAMSDIWTFKVINPPKPVLPVVYTSYIELRQGLDASLATAGASLNVTYDNAAADSLVHYTISSIQEAGNPVVQQGSLPLRRGRNWLTVPLNNGGYSRGKLYLFQFSNGRNESWNIKFTPASK
jgi:hypothetical protein